MWSSGRRWGSPRWSPCCSRPPSHGAGLGTSGPAVIAAVRATVQLAAVSLFIGAIVGSFAAGAAFVAVLLVVAPRTGGKRMTDDRSGWWAALPVALAPLTVANTRTTR